jgi:hypothetical protein
MIARLDHHPMLTAALALTTAVLVVVVITLATLLITAEPPAATSSSQSGVGNPGAAVAGTGENYGSMWIAPNPTQQGASVAPHQDIPSAHYGL